VIQKQYALINFPKYETGIPNRAKVIVTPIIKNIKKARKTFVPHALFFLTSAGGGERGIRTPGPITVGSFQDCCNQPLCHFSGAKIILFLVFQVLFKKLP
jgi:hypothetical protein